MGEESGGKNEGETDREKAGWLKYRAVTRTETRSKGKSERTEEESETGEIIEVFIEKHGRAGEKGVERRLSKVKRVKAVMKLGKL